jgi:hypothetical protein
MLHLDVREGGPDMLEDVDAEVVVLGGVEGQVEQQEIFEVRRAVDFVLFLALCHCT